MAPEFSKEGEGPSSCYDRILDQLPFPGVPNPKWGSGIQGFSSGTVWSWAGSPLDFVRTNILLSARMKLKLKNI